jgi:hypothetical protein
VISPFIVDNHRTILGDAIVIGDGKETYIGRLPIACVKQGCAAGTQKLRLLDF